MVALDAVFETARHQCPALSVLLFDLDGTLFDTMSLHYEAYREALATLGGRLERADFDRLSGPPARVTIPGFMNAAGLPDPDSNLVSLVHSHKRQILAQRLHAASLPLLPAALLAQRHAGNYRYALVTSGNAGGAMSILQAGGLAELFPVRISGDDVTEGKPAPTPYLEALAALAVSPEQALAFEDHDNGIKAALGAGISVIDVRDATLMRAE